MTNVNTPGYYSIMAEVKLMYGDGDPWGTNIAWLFALADYKWYWCGELMPGYTPAPSKFDMRDVSYELQILTDTLDQWEDSDIDKVYKVLSRYDDWLRAAGKNY
jgi:hypothetical protein